MLSIPYSIGAQTIAVLLGLTEAGIDPSRDRGEEDRQEGQQKTAAVRLPFELPLLGSNQDSPDPESGVLPVTPRGSEPSDAVLDPHLLHLYGAEGDRTPDLCSAIAALSQLSYSPVIRRRRRAMRPLGQRHTLNDATADMGARGLEPLTSTMST